MKGKRRFRQLRFMLIGSAIILFLFLIMQPLEVLRYRRYIDILFPSGLIAIKERDLLLTIQVIMLLVIIPVYVLTFFFSWRYRAYKSKAKYDPDLVDNTLAEYIWWGIPFVIILIISILTGIRTYELDPYKPIESDKKAITIQVVALQWKWLFIYPEEKIATVNYFHIPEKTPIHFEITADAPMNSFWIPQLGSQIYAMPNMKTELYLIADKPGLFKGASANLSGEGFSAMHFSVEAMSEEKYKEWMEAEKKSEKALSWEEYEKLAAPGEVKPESFQLKEDALFHQILMKYMPQKKNG